MIEIRLDHGTMCRSCGEDILQGASCFVQEHHVPFNERSISEQIDEGTVFCAKCMNDPSVAIHKVVKIDPEGRFIFFIDADISWDVIEEMRTEVREWWESGDKFLFATGSMTLLRLSEDGEAEVIYENET